MQAPETSPRYRSYLLRCWEERPAPSEAAAWRCIIEEVSGGKRHGFATPEAMLDFLRRQLSQADDSLAAASAAHDDSSAGGTP